jgi:cytochrome P450
MRLSADAAIAEEAALSPNEEAKGTIGASSHNIFRTILNSSLPLAEKEAKRLGQEGFVAIAAGGETCGRMLTRAIYYVLENKERVMPPLMKELRSVMHAKDTVPILSELERLPYFTGIIKETLRLSALLTSRLPLVAPAQSLTYGDFVIPPGHPVSMSLRHILHNDAIFRQAMEFVPERWLKTDPDIKTAERFYVPFSKGSRNCIGIR